MLEQVHKQLGSKTTPLQVYVCKGLESGTNALPIEIIASTLGKDAAREAVFLVRSRLALSSIRHS